MKFTENSAPVKRSRVLLAGCLGWLAAASAHANTITVINTNDGGHGSLRQAIADANDGDIINARGVFGSIELSSGELPVNKNLTINGPGADKLSVENTHSSRVFEIGSDKIVAISGLAINSGEAALGVTNSSGSVVIQNCTINGNTVEGPSGFGFGGNIFMVEGTMEIGNTILNAGSGGNLFSFGNQGIIISDGYNLSSDNGADYLTAAGDQVNTDPRVGPLQDNGCPTVTHALLADSPAINAGNPNYNPTNFHPPLIYDQPDVGFDQEKKARRE